MDLKRQIGILEAALPHLRYTQSGNPKKCVQLLSDWLARWCTVSIMPGVKSNPSPESISMGKEPDGTRCYQWTGMVTISVADVWVADGFDLTPERFQDMISDALASDLCHAHGTELAVKTEIIHGPNPDSVAREMGYESHAHMLEKEAQRKAEL